MHWRLYFLTVFFANIILAISGIEDKPPTITYIATKFPDNVKELKDPADYVQIASNSNVGDVVNSMICKATNADRDGIKWQYKDSVDGIFSDTLPATITAETPNFNPDNDNEVELKINDGKYTKRVDLEKLNGYYRCVASNQGGKYQALSATVRVILPFLVGTEIAPKEPADGNRVQGQPYRLPCVRPKDTDGDGYEIIPADTAKFSSEDAGIQPVKFTWYKTNEANAIELDLTSADRTGRVKQDPTTGDLYFAYLTPIDQVSDQSGDARLTCQTRVGSLNQKITNEVIKFTVAVSNADKPNVTFQNPFTTEVDFVSDKIREAKKVVKCVEGKQCQITCIFGGSYGKEGKIRGRRDGETITEPGTSTGFSFLAVGTPVSQKWQCELFNDKTNELYMTLIVNVVILNYPALTNTDLFPPTRYEKTGTTVNYVCAAEHVTGFNTDFFINGEQVTDKKPDYVRYEPSIVDTEFEIVNVQRSHSSSILCVGTNEAGSLYVTSDLVVYDAAVLEQYPLAVNPHVVKESSDNTTLKSNLFVFNCWVTLDVKANGVKTYWKSNISGLAGQEIVKEDSKGIKVVNIPKYVAGSGIINTSLTLELTSGSDSKLRDTKWQCVVEYSILGHRMGNITSDPVLFTIIAPPIPPEPLVAFPHYPLIFGAVGGFLFLILLIVLINCYVQKNKGEQYYVDEKERKAGHNPEEEMEAYGFSDYTRPDQNPIKGSRASMNFSDKPMESDTGSLDEYGDIDPGRYNEDGSFIGQYGQNGQPSSRNQADV